MPEPAKKKTTYDDLYSIPDNMIGEIIDGELIVTPRPSRKHIIASSYLGAELIPPYCHGRGGGPGGWVILIEPEIKLGEHILVPDLAGWKEERFPDEEPHNWISISPDWVCEMLSPNTRRLDRMEKMPIYAQYEVPYLWLTDPEYKTLEVYRLREGEWVVTKLFKDEAKVRAVPFMEVEIDLSDIWRKARRAQATEAPKD